MFHLPFTIVPTVFVQFFAIVSQVFHQEGRKRRQKRGKMKYSLCSVINILEGKSVSTKLLVEASTPPTSTTRVGGRMSSPASTTPRRLGVKMKAKNNRARVVKMTEDEKTEMRKTTGYQVFHEEDQGQEHEGYHS